MRSMTSNNLILKGKRIAITGAGRGLGRALAIVLADAGANVVLLGRDLVVLQAVAEAIQGRTNTLPLAVSCDLAQAQSVADACKTVLNENELLDGLINNGAPWLTGNLSDLSDQAILGAINAAVSGTLLITKGLLAGLQRSEAADVVTIVSSCGVLGWDSQQGINEGMQDSASTAFYAAKHGQSGLSDRLHHELKPQGIRVSAVYPPDFDDADPLDSSWGAPSSRQADVDNMSSYAVVSTIVHILTAPRSCSFPMVVLDNA